ncbi:MAG: PepSY domain-containing protein [Saprospiraceae bacterium]|nr:PepSY domain-containing protein [Saprospiraceae bacterium]
MSRITKSLRKYRVYHKYFGLSLAILLLISALTGIFLAWKKDIDWIQPPTQKGESKELQAWKPISELAELAESAFQKAHPEFGTNTIDRIDVRPSKGIAKVLFDKGWWEVQIDGTSGEVLSIAKRHSDWIEKLHDGSIVSDLFKLITMNGLGIGLIILMVTGLWLWYGPRLFRKWKRRRKPAS